MTPEEIKKKPYIRLNLGCGKKIYPRKEHWVNVDVTDENPDIDFKADARKLSKTFEENSVNEIHAYHLVEHFYKEELPLILKDWYKILKPGGLLFVETPDAKKCAINFISGLIKGNIGTAMELGLKGFYGDVPVQNPQREYHLHKWLYFPETLSPIIASAGFIEVEEEAAVTHAKEERDMRLVAKKPLVEGNTQQDNNNSLESKKEALKKIRKVKI